MKIVVTEHPKLYYPSPLDKLLSTPPWSTGALEVAQKQISSHEYPRKALSEILKTYNQDIGNDPQALVNCAKLAQSDSKCVITGQQLGLMGGPAYTILKAITCLLMARETQSIPIFWLATEDHDIAEINHTYFLDPLGNIKRFHLSFNKDRTFVEDLLLTPQHRDELTSLLKFLNLPLEKEMEIEISEDEDAENNAKDGENTSYTRTMISFLIKLFKGTGLVFVEPKLLRPLAKSFFRQEIIKSDALYEALAQTSKKLEALKGIPALKIKEGPNLFYKDEHNQRLNIRKDGTDFTIGHKKYSQSQLLDLCEKNPENFSTNVIARTALQSSLFPTLAYVAGPSEIAYYRQLGEYHRLHGVEMPWIVPRISATLLVPEVVNYFEKSHLKPWEEIPLHWDRAMPLVKEGVQSLLDVWKEQAQELYAQELSTKSFRHYVIKQQQLIRRGTWKNYLDKQGIPNYALHLLRNTLHPRNRLQERVINWQFFQTKTTENLVQELLQQVNWRETGHHYCFLK